MATFLLIHNKRWYYRLVPDKEKPRQSLFDQYGLESLGHHLVVCFTPDTLPGADKPLRTRDGRLVRLFAFFDSYLEFYHYQFLFPEHQRAFYEIMLGEFPQKPHFDLDADRASFLERYPDEDFEQGVEMLRQALLGACLTLLPTIDLNKDVLWYSSNGPVKRSYHLIIANHAHEGNGAAKDFYGAALSLVSKETGGKFLELVDRAVYSPRQQFRILGSQKPGSNRPKIFRTHFTFHGQEYEHQSPDTGGPLVQLWESLGSFTPGCRIIPNLQAPRLFTPRLQGPAEDLEDAQVKECLLLMKDKFSPCPFKLKEVRGKMILLQREAPSLCPLCQRSHQNENPYLIVTGGQVWWDCRRSTGDKFLLGTLGVRVEPLMTPYEIEIPLASPFSFLVETPTNPGGVPPPFTPPPLSLPPRDVLTLLNEQVKQWDQRKESQQESSLTGVWSEMSWKAGY